MNRSDVPGIDVVEAKLSEIDSGLTVESTDYVFDRMVYRMVLTGHGREAVVEFSRELLEVSVFDVQPRFCCCSWVRRFCKAASSRPAGAVSRTIVRGLCFGE